MKLRFCKHSMIMLTSHTSFEQLVTTVAMYYVFTAKGESMAEECLVFAISIHFFIIIANDTTILTAFN